MSEIVYPSPISESSKAHSGTKPRVIPALTFRFLCFTHIRRIVFRMIPTTDITYFPKQYYRHVSIMATECVFCEEGIGFLQAHSSAEFPTSRG